MQAGSPEEPQSSVASPLGSVAAASREAFAKRKRILNRVRQEFAKRIKTESYEQMKARKQN